MSELQSFNVVDKDHVLVGDGVSEVSEVNVSEGEVDADSIDVSVGGDGVGGDGIGGHGGVGKDDKPIVADLSMI